VIRRLAAAVTAGLVVALAGALPAAADEVRDAQWHLEFLNVEEAHTISQGENVVVAVVDTGVDADHPDLARSTLSGADLTPSGAGGNGLTDLDGHGTAMAGLIAAHGRALGIAPSSKILPIRTTVGGPGLDDPIHEGIDRAIAEGVDIICVAAASEHFDDLQDAVQRALDANIVVVAGVGNTPESTAVEYPAAYPGVVAVAGVDRQGNHADVSVKGPEVVLAAPAVEIVTTDRWEPQLTGYQRGTGTSDATAIIAGAAALVRSKFPDLSAAEVVHRLTATADDKGAPGRDPEYGYGIVNLVRALTEDVPPLTPSAGPTTTQAAPRTPEGAITPSTRAVLIGLGVVALIGLGIAGFALRRRSAS
jgi:type VII secretion-associated serine protease mycosin